MPRPKGWQKASRIAGWFQLAEAELLSALCTGTWCEIGCHHGRSTVVLAETGHQGYAIDTWLGSPEMPRVDSFTTFRRNIDEYENVKILKSDFREVAELVPARLQLLHLDADHSYEMTKLAFDLYIPKLLGVGYVCLHDARGGHWPGVERLRDELVNQGDWILAAEAKSLVALQRR